MTALQKIIKQLALFFAVVLIVLIVGGIVRVLGVFFESPEQDSVTKESTTYTVSDAVTSLDILINAANLTIRDADTFSVESNLKHLTVKEENGVLIIEEDRKTVWGMTYGNASLIIGIPKDTEFQKVAVVTGAGKLSVGTLRAQTLQLELGAGEADIQSLTATTSADIDGGAGKLAVHNGSLTNLDLDMGVGQLTLTSSLLGDCELDMGIGKSNVTLLGDKAQYAVSVEKGLGNLTVDGKNVSDFGSFGNGTNKVEIDGGVGAIQVQFSES